MYMLELVYYKTK